MCYSDCSQVCESNILYTKAWLLKAPSTAVKMYVQGRDVFVGRPKISGKWLCSTILPTSLVNLPCLLEKHGVDESGAGVPRRIPHKIRLVHETRLGAHSVVPIPNGDIPSEWPLTQGLETLGEKLAFLYTRRPLLFLVPDREINYSRLTGSLRRSGPSAT